MGGGGGRSDGDANDKEVKGPPVEPKVDDKSVRASGFASADGAEGAVCGSEMRAVACCRSPE